MGVTLDLRVVDHERIVVQGLRAIDDAVRQQNPELLRGYLAQLPIDVDPVLVEQRRSRLEKLRELEAPTVIIANEARLLRLGDGSAYQPEAFRNASFDELRQLLGTWCWITHSYSLDKAWEPLHWFLEPRTGPAEAPLYPAWPRRSDPGQSLVGKALEGEMRYPLDALGDPVIRTLGSSEPDCSGYNPPATCQAILVALQRIEPARWVEHVPFRRQLYRQSCREIVSAEIDDWVADELAWAQDGFAILLQAYTAAVDRGAGVSCEYSL